MLKKTYTGKIERTRKTTQDYCNRKKRLNSTPVKQKAEEFLNVELSHGKLLVGIKCTLVDVMRSFVFAN